MKTRHRRSPIARVGILVPPHEVEIYLALGWQLADEPICGNVRMLPPTQLHNPAPAEGATQ